MPQFELMRSMRSALFISISCGVLPCCQRDGLRAHPQRRVKLFSLISETRRQLFSACILRMSTVKIGARCRVWVPGGRNWPMLADFTTEARRHRDKTMILQLRAGAERAI